MRSPQAPGNGARGARRRALASGFVTLNLAAAGLLAASGLPAAAAEPTPAAPAPPAAAVAAPAPASPAPAAADVAAPAGPLAGFSFALDPLVIEGLSTHEGKSKSAKFQEYEDLSSGFRVPLMRLLGESADGNRTMLVRVENGGKRDGRYTLDYRHAGSWGLLLDYDQIVHNLGNDARTLWSESTPGVFSIPGPQRAAVAAAIAHGTPGATALAPYLADASLVDLGLERDRAHAQLQLNQSGPVLWTLDFLHEKRTGDREGTASFDFASTNELPEPIDFESNDAGISGDWRGKNGNLNFGLKYSGFTNHIDTLTYDNPLVAPGNPNAQGRSALAPDNYAGTVFAGGRTVLGGGWWLNGNASYLDMRQNTALIPYAINPTTGIGFNGQNFDATNPANLPQSRSGQKAGSISANGAIGNNFGDGFHLLVHYRYYDYDNSSNPIAFPGYVLFNEGWTPTARVTVPFAFRNADIGSELNWDFSGWGTLGVSYDHHTIGRREQEADNESEDIGKLSLDARPNDRLTLRASFQYGQRSIASYDYLAEIATFVDQDPAEASNQPSLRKFNEAARKVDGYNLQADYSITDQLGLQLTANGDHDDYDQSALGLIDNTTNYYNAELDWTRGDQGTFYLYVSYQTERSRQEERESAGAAASTNPLDNWGLGLDDATDAFGLGWTSVPAPGWRFNVNGEFSRTYGTANFSASPGGAPLSGAPARTSPANINNYDDTKLITVRTSLDYTVNRHVGVGVYYRYDDYNLNTFSLTGLTGNFFAGNTLLLNPNNGPYVGSILGINTRLTF